MAAAPAAPDALLVQDWSLLTSEDLYLFNEGSHCQLGDKLGAHQRTVGEVAGTYFAVWAPSAEQVFVVGEFNDWNKTAHPLRPREQSGIWEGFIPGASPGQGYKYHVVSRYQGYRVDKADPYAFRAAVPPRTESIIWELDYTWNDDAWMRSRSRPNSLGSPVSIYELHLGSWRRQLEEDDRPLTYRELAEPLAEYVHERGYTHVEFMPVMEHPFYGSWGYQVTGYFAPTSRYGTPQDFMYLVDHLHQQGIGVILDWVPSHFPTDEHGLMFFDGTHLYEHSDTRKGYHPDWNTAIFNYGRHEVAAFLLSNALFWLDRYHADGLRVDAVASMLYLDYSRKAGEWVPNRYGGRENLEALAFLRKLNETIKARRPDVLMIAEESTAWPMVSRPTYLGGLGFDLKWDMGWMHDTLHYFERDPVHRMYHHDQLTFRMLYAFTENFVLALSHDEVVHGKGSLIDRTPGDWWVKFANLRLLLGYQFAQPGKKLLFMGDDFGQWQEWNHEQSLDWHLLDMPTHQGVARFVTDLNRLYRSDRALHEQDHAPAGFEWIDASDAKQSVLAFLRRGRLPEDVVLVVANFTPVPRLKYRIGVPYQGWWKELLNSDAAEYGGSSMGNSGGRQTDAKSWHGRPVSLELTLPPLGILFFRFEGWPG
jgi:1,4-alpha-glucan branching enzyme